MEWLAFIASVRRTVSRRIANSVCRGVASSEAELAYSPEGRSTTLERGGAAVRGVVEGLGRETSSEAEIALRVRGGCEWAVL